MVLMYFLFCVVGSPYGMSSVAAMASMLSSLGGPMSSMFPPSGPGGTGFNAAQFLQQSKSNFRHCECSSPVRKNVSFPY